MTDQEITLRQMTIDDIGTVYHIGENLFGDILWDEQEVMDYYTFYPEYCVVAEQAGKVIGFSLACITRSHSKVRGYIGWTGVDKPCQLAGIGLSLFRFLEGKLQSDGVEAIFTDVANNLRVFAHEEWTVVGTRVRYHKYLVGG